MSPLPPPVDRQVEGCPAPLRQVRLALLAEGEEGVSLEEWRHVAGWPYEVSNAGRVRRIGATRPLRMFVHQRRCGYLSVSLWMGGVGKRKYVHRLVCEAFNGPSPAPKMHAAHANGDPADNRPCNLRWATVAENERDKVAHGRANIGSRNGQSTLTEEQVSEIRALIPTLPRSTGGKRFKKGTIGPLLKKYGITRVTLWSVMTGVRWRHVV